MSEQAEENPLGLHPVDLVLALVVISLSTALVLLDRFVVPAFAGMYKDFGGELPTVTRLVLAHASTLGGAALSVVMAILGVFARKRGATGAALGMLGGGIAMAVFAVGFSMYALYAPVFDLAGKVKP